MRNKKYQIAIISLILSLLGLGLSAYQHFFLGLPLVPDSHKIYWSVEAAIDFTPKEHNSVKVYFYIPNAKRSFVELNESFISRNYGVNIHTAGDNRQAIWSIRKANGPQKLYYRISLVKSKLNKHLTKAEIEEPTVSEEEPFQGAELEAAMGLISHIQSHSADIATFTAQAIKEINDARNSNAKLLLSKTHSPEEIAAVVVRVLSLAKIKSQTVHAIMLEPALKAKPQIWLRSFDGTNWYYFDPISGESSSPNNCLQWWFGQEPLLKVEGATHESVVFSVKPADESALTLAQHAGNAIDSPFIKFSLLSLPIQTQQIYQILVTVPLGVFIILLLRTFVGVQTFGTFMPVLIAMAFRETHLLWGILLFGIVILLGIGIRAYLNKLRLLLVARLSIILSMVVIIMGFISIVTYKLGIEPGLSIALFPIVILTMTIERLSILLDERGNTVALKTALGSAISASLAYCVMSNHYLTHIMFIFPGLLLNVVALMLLLGRYRGYRLSELLRFKDLTRTLDDQ